MTTKYAALDFYKLLYHTDQDCNLTHNLYLALFCPPYKKEHAQVLWHTNIVKALAEANELKRDVHMQVALSDKKIANGKRNNAQFVGEQCIAAFPAFFADIDCYKLFDDYVPGTIPDELRSILEIDDLKPTAYVNSGGGLHVWWVFDQLFLADTSEKRKELATLLTRFGSMLSSRVGKSKIKFDSVFDLARVLRVIGSYNYKLDTPRKCELIEFDPDNTYMIAQIEDICDVYTIPIPDLNPYQTPQQTVEINGKQIPIDIINETPDFRLIVLEPEQEGELNDKLESLCDADDEFSRAFACYGLTRYDSKIDISKILQKLAYRAAVAAEYNLMFSDTEIYYIFKMFIGKHGVNNEQYQDRKRITRIETFVKPTIQKARKLAAEHIAANELKSLSEKPRDTITTGDLKKIYETIKRLHNFSLISFTKISDGSYEIVTGNGLVSIPNIDTLGDQKKLQLRFMECTNTTFQPIKVESYRHTLNMMFSVMQTRLSDPEKDLDQQIRSFLIDYILQSNDLDQTSEDMTLPEKSKSTGRWKILLEVFAKWLKNIHGLTVTMPSVAKAMLSIDADRNHGRFHGIRRHHWLLPEDFTLEIDSILEERDERLGTVSI